MRLKKITSAVLAAAIVFGMSAAVPAEFLSDSGMVTTVSAASGLKAPKYSTANHYSYSYTENGRTIERSAVSISWSRVPEAERYYVFLYNNSTKKYSRIGETTETHFNIDDIKSGSVLYYKIQSVKTVNGKKITANSKKFSCSRIDIEYGKAVDISKNQDVRDFKITDIYASSSSVNADDAKKAVECAKKSKFYEKVMVEMYNPDVENNGVPEYFQKIKSYYNSDGTLQPRAKKEYLVDLNKDGKPEKFILLDIPDSLYPLGAEDDITPAEILVYADSSGNMQAINMFHSDETVQLVDYGKFCHLFIGGFGYVGAYSHCAMYGLSPDGNLKEYLDSRCDIERSAETKLMLIKGLQGSGGTYCYNVSTDEYLCIKGKKVKKSQLLALDKDGILDKYKGDNYECRVIGGKYYTFCEKEYPMSSFWSYVYENGKIVLHENAVMSFSETGTLNYTTDIDLSKIK